MRHELFELIEARSPRWQVIYRTLAHAAFDLGLGDQYRDFLRTDAGVEYLAMHNSVHDHVADNARRASAIAAERAMAAQGARELRAENIADVVRNDPYSTNE